MSSEPMTTYPDHNYQDDARLEAMAGVEAPMKGSL